MPRRILKILDKVTPGASRSLGWEVILTILTLPASIIINRLLGSEDRGILALVILIPTTIFNLGTCQWEKYLRGLILSKEISSREAWRRTLYYSKILSAIFIPIGIALTVTFNKLPTEVNFLSVIYYINFPVYLLGGCLSSIYISNGFLTHQYKIKIWSQIFYLSGIFILFITNSIHVASMVFMNMGIHVVALFIGLTHKDRLLSGEISQQRPSLIPLAKAFPSYALESFAARIDAWAFSIFTSLSSLGQYTALTSMMLPIGMVSSALTTASTANIDWSNLNAVRRYLFRTIVVMVTLMIGLGVGGFFVGEYLLYIFLGKSFQNAAWMIPWISAIVVTQAVAIQFHSTLQLSGNINAYLKIQLIDPFIRSFNVVILGYYFSEIGILIAMIVSSIIKITGCWIFIRKYKNVIVGS